MAAYLIPALVSYLLGAVPFGLLIALSRGIDVRKVGSGNIGATNVFRAVGKPWGILAFALDFLKGFAAAAWVPALVARVAGVETPAYAPLVCGVCAVVGHTWPVWLRFKGGKGVATGAGLLVAIAPHSALCAVGAWIVFFLATRYVSFASIMRGVAAIRTSPAIFSGQRAARRSAELPPIDHPTRIQRSTFSITFSGSPSSCST